MNICSKENIKRYGDLLRSAGLKATRPRLCVLAILTRSRLPLRVKDIKETLKKKGHRVDTVTIYRTIELLAKTELVRRIDFAEDAAYYELATDEDCHHIICKTCHRREEVRFCFYNKHKKAIKASLLNFATVDRHNILYLGVCKKCANSAS